MHQPKRRIPLLTPFFSLFRLCTFSNSLSPAASESGRVSLSILLCSIVIAPSLPPLGPAFFISFLLSIFALERGKIQLFPLRCLFSDKIVLRTANPIPVSVRLSESCLAVLCLPAGILDAVFFLRTTKKKRLSALGPDSLDKNFGLKNQLRFNSDSVTCLSNPFLNSFSLFSGRIQDVTLEMERNEAGAKQSQVRP